jgi:O-antigen/teichoic acid export membrane protein
MKQFQACNAVLRRLRTSAVARNTAWMTSGNGVRVAIQAGYFILIARCLGPAQYGAFVGAVALIAMVAPFSSFGFGNILVKNTSRDPASFPDGWGNALLVTVIGSAILIVAVVGIAHLLFRGRLSVGLVLPVAIADLLCFAVVNLSGQAFVAFEKMKGTATTLIVLSICRFSAAVALSVASVHPTASTWAWLYMASSAAAACFAVAFAWCDLGRPRFVPMKVRPELIEGFYFAVGTSSQTIYNDIDKTMLVRLSDLFSAGIYATAYRMVDMAFQPVSSFMYSCLGTFFRAGEDGVDGSMKVARRVLPIPVVYGAVAGTLLFISAPVLPVVLGRGFSDSVAALRWLAAIILIRPLHYVGATVLTGAGFQGTRAAIQIVVAATNIFLNLWLIPTYSWRGAAWASVVSDCLLVVMFWIAAFLLSRSQAQSVVLPHQACD